MNILFVHRNFPAQYNSILRELLKNPAHKIAAIGSETARAPRGVLLRKYSTRDGPATMAHPFARRFDVESHRAEQVLYALTSLVAANFKPDLILAHPGWGETLPLRTVFPKARLLIYCEFFYGREARDVGFDPEFPDGGLDGHVALHAKNAATLLALAESDGGVSPTQWQRSTFPKVFQPTIDVIHEGVDVDRIRPNPDARFSLTSGRALTRQDEVVTFVARNLEPQRGYHIFMRALPRILAARPKAQVLIIGSHGVSYGAAAPRGQSWKDIFLAEVAGGIDPNRVHFTGRLSYEKYIAALQVSSVHVYLTYPFVLSWSVLEAMSAGCLVIGSHTTPVSEAIQHERNGLLVPFFDRETLAEQVVGGLARRRSFDSLRHEARRTVLERYDQKRICVPKLLSLIGAVQKPQPPMVRSVRQPYPSRETVSASPPAAT